MHSPLLSILHISDFHHSVRSSREQEIVVDALIKDLETLCIGHRRPDVVLFTGDLVNAGGTDGHSEAYDFLLARIASATGCSDERIFIVPGNHDLSRTVVDATHEEHLEWRGKANDMEAINALYDAGAFSEVAAQKFSAYQELESYLSESTLRQRNAFASVNHIEPLNIDVVVLNTSMFSTGGHPEHGKDAGKLAVPEYAVIEVLKTLTPDSYRIFATHHPFGMLSDTGARYLRSAIEEHAHLHVFGHMHDPQSSNTTSFRGNLYSDQAGAIFTHRQNNYIGYSLISVDRSTEFYETFLRTYFDDRKKFDEALDVVEQGRFYSSQGARDFWRKIATPVDDKIFREHLAGSCLDALVIERGSSSDGRDPHEMFISPRMMQTHVQAVSGDQTESTSETPVTFEELILEDRNAIIIAATEFGRTSVLMELQYQLFARADTLRLPRLPIIVDFEDIKANVRSLSQVIKSRALELPSKIDVESLLKLGHVCLLVDDVVFSDMKRMAILRAFVENHPKVRYVLSSTKNSSTPFGAKIAPEMPIHFVNIELQELRRHEMRQLIAKYNGGTDVETVLDRLQTEIQEINIPFTAANGSILLDIYEGISGFRPINRSVLIEQFVDTTLRKAAMEQSQRETFDYANKTALLAHVAAWMAKQENFVPSAESVRAEMNAYLDRIGLNASLDDLMREFLTVRIFIKRSENRMSFRYRSVSEYFIAMQMRDDPKFKAWVMEEDRYLQFMREIHYYSGKLRNDIDLVNEVGRRFAVLLQQAEDARGGIDLDKLSSLQLPAKDGDLTVEHLSRQLSAPPIQEKERDKELEDTLPRDAESHQEVSRPQFIHDGQRLFGALLLYSGLVKNMELIDDTEKRRHLTELWKGWAVLLHSSLGGVHDLARHRRVRINGVLYELNAPKGMTDSELVRIISLQLPSSITALLSTILGTEKLERQIVEPELDTTNQPLAYEFLRAALIADLQLTATPGAIRTALERLNSSSYLLEAFIWKIAGLRRMDRFQLGHFEEITAPLASAIANLKGGTKAARGKEREQQLQRLRKEGLMLRIKRQNEPN